VCALSRLQLCISTGSFVPQALLLLNVVACSFRGWHADPGSETSQRPQETRCRRPSVSHSGKIYVGVEWGPVRAKKTDMCVVMWAVACGGQRRGEGKEGARDNAQASNSAVARSRVFHLTPATLALVNHPQSSSALHAIIPTRTPSLTPVTTPPCLTRAPMQHKQQQQQHHQMDVSASPSCSCCCCSSAQPTGHTTLS
jgi:hypothetical protein